MVLGSRSRRQQRGVATKTSLCIVFQFQRFFSQKQQRGTSFSKAFYFFGVVLGFAQKENKTKEFFLLAMRNEKKKAMLLETKANAKDQGVWALLATSHSPT